MHTNNKPFIASLSVIVLLIALTLNATAQNARLPNQILFDDFSYANKEQLKKNGWIVRTVDGWPGVPARSGWTQT